MKSLRHPISYLLFALVVIVLVCLVDGAPARRPVVVANSETSDDDRWDDGFGFGKAEQFFRRVNAIAVIDNNVYVGGDFKTAGDATVSGVAQWDGETWSNLGGGLDDCRHIFCSPTVYALEVRGKNLYAGGNFSSVGGVASNRVASWDGARNWSGLGSGVSGYVSAIAFKDNEVYAGGVFFRAGGKVAHSFARWVDPTVIDPPTPSAPELPQITGFSTAGKKLIVTGERFDLGAMILLNGEAQKTRNDEHTPATTLIARKSGKRIKPGDKLQVRNGDGKLSAEFLATP